MKEGWVYKKLGEIATTINGLWKGKKEPFVNVGVIRNANFTKDITLDFSKIEYLNVEERQYQKRKLQKGDLIVEKSGGSEKQPVGRTVLFNAEGEFSVSNFTSILRINNQNEITPEFLYKYLLYIYREGWTKEMQNATTGIHNIIFEKFLAISIPVPPLSDQQRIVSYLDAEFAKIEALKANAEKQLQAAKDLFQAALKELLTPKEGWVEKKLVEEFSLKSGDYLPTKEQKEGTIPVYGGNGITGYHNLYNLSGEQILIGRVGALCGNIHYVNENIWVTDNAFVLTNISESWYKLFLVYELGYLNLNQFASQTAQPVISNKSMKDVIIAQPHLSEQQRIADRLDALSANVKALQTNYTETITLCNDLKQALLKKVFEEDG